MFDFNESRSKIKDFEKVSPELRHRMFGADPDYRTKNHFMTLSDEELVAIDLERTRIFKTNCDIKVNNAVIFAEIENHLNDLLKSLNVRTEKRKNSGRVVGYYAHFKKIMEEIRGNTRRPDMRKFSYVEIDGIRYDYQRSFGTTSLREFVTDIRSQIEVKERKEREENILMKKTIAIASKEGIDIEGLSNKEICRTVNFNMLENWREENYPDGTEVNFKHGCDGCNTWIVGDNRCSCGNRRMGLEIEGDYISGYTAYPTPN